MKTAREQRSELGTFLALNSLLTPFALKSLSLSNRVVMAPMTRAFAPRGAPTAEIAAYYRRRAEGGVGLIVSEGVGLDRSGSRHLSSVPVLHTLEAKAGWLGVVQAVKAAGASMAVQLWHVGGHADPLGREICEDLESPSGLTGPKAAGGRLMSEADAADAISAFGRAAATASKLGFDAIEIHGAHGYLVDQFFWRETNRRSDYFGGATPGERARFGAAIVAEVRRAVGPEIAIIMRISQWKLGAYDAKLAKTPAELEAWLGPLSDAGVDLFHCSQRRFWETEFEGSDLNLAGWVKKLLRTPTVTVGSIGLGRDVMSDFNGSESCVNIKSFVELERRFERGDFDLAAVGRPLLADPDWLTKVLQGEFAHIQPYSAAQMLVLS